MSDDLKIQGEVSLDTSNADSAFARVEQGADRMAKGVRTSGQQASDAVSAIGDGGEVAAQKVDRAAASIVSSIRRATAEQERALAAMQSGGAGMPDYFENLASKRGADISAVRPLIAGLADLQSQVSVTTASVRELAAAAEFDRLHEEAKKFTQDAEYIRMYTAELDKRAAAEVEANSVVLFEKQHQAAKQLVKDAEYVRVWTDALDQRERAEAKLASQGAFVTSLQKQSEAIGKSRADLLELQAAEMGVADKAAPFIARLREAEQGVAKTGISAAQTAAALRGIPAQFTDIVVSLQSGQAPLTVMLQQGGQLKDMFGGAGNAAKALSEYVLGMVNPFTLAAVVVAAVSYSFYKGAMEASDFRKQVILSGNAAGVASGEFADLAFGVSSVVGTTGQAADVLTRLVSTGRIARENLTGASAAIIAMSNAGGPAVKELVKDFEALGKKPSEAILDLNERYSFLTATTYRQITALEEQGRVEEAAALAQSKYSTMLADRAKDIVTSLGYVERAWKAIKEEAQGALDSIKDIGRDIPFEAQIAKLSKAAAEARARAAGSKGTFGDESLFGASRRATAEADEYDRQVARLKEDRLRAGASAATLANRQSAENAAVEATQALEKQRKALLSGAAKVESELIDYRRRISDIRLVDPNSPLLNPSLIASDEKSIREKYSDKDAIRATAKAAEEAKRELERYRNLVVDLAGEQSGLSANFNEQVSILYKGWKRSGDSVEVYDRALSQLIDRQPFAVKALKEQAEFEKKWAEERKKRYAEVENLAEAEVKAAQQDAKSAADRVLALREEEDAIQRSRIMNINLAQAIEDVRIARLGAAIAAEQAKPDASQEKIDALAAEIRARRELASLNTQKVKRDDANTDLKKFMTPDLNTDLSAGFDKSSQAAGAFVQTLVKLSDAQERYNKVKVDSKASQADLAKAEIGFQRSQLNGYAALAGAAKGFFGEKTAGYKVMMAAEQGLRAVELANSIASITSTLAEGQAKAVVGVVNQANGDPYSAFPRMAAMAAIMAGLGFAISGGFGGGGKEPAVALNSGTGTVLGDPGAQSESIAKAIDHLKEVDTLTMQYSAQMLASLRNIESSLAGVTGQILRNGGGITGVDFTSVRTQNSEGLVNSILGVTKSVSPVFTAVDKMLGGSASNIAGRLLGSLFGSTKSSLADSGLQFFGQSLKDVLTGGIAAQSYQTVETTKKALFGLSKSSSSSTNFQALDSGLTNQFTSLIKDTYGSITAASKALGLGLDQVEAKIAGFTVDLGRISLKGLSGEQIQERLTAVFGSFADNLATAAASQYADFQKAGEGYYETLIRVASGFESATYLLDRLGVSTIDLLDITRSQGDVAAELVRQSLQAKEGLTGIANVLGVLDGTAEEIASAYTTLAGARTTLGLLGLNGSAVDLSLIKGAGGVDALADSLKAFEDGFVDDSKKVSNQAVRMSFEFERLGLAMPKSGQDFYALVKGIDTSTEAGRNLLGSVLGLSSGFADLLGAIRDVGSGIADEIERIKGLSSADSTKSLAELQADFLIKTAQARAGDQGAIDILPQISQALLKAAEATAGSSLDVAVLQARTLASLQATLDAISDPTKRLTAVPGFASGGLFSGGYRIVGENGPELEATGASRIFDAATTARIFGGTAGGGVDMSAVLDELKALRAVVSALRGDTQNGTTALLGTTNRAANVLERVCEDTQSFNVRTVTS